MKIWCNAAMFYEYIISSAVKKLLVANLMKNRLPKF